MSADPLFRLDRITFAYEAARPVLSGLDFTLAPGERVALTGANGAGKSTLLQIMVGLLRPTRGTIEAFGRVRTAEADFREVRLRAGLVFQDPDDQLFCPTVAEDIAFGPLNMGKSHDEARAAATATLAQVGLAGFEDRITYKLSGGEKRLVSLATVLAMEPEVLLFDEPTAGLDEAHLERCVAIMRGLPQAMVVISHDRPVLDRIATRVVRLADGRLDPA